MSLDSQPTSTNQDHQRGTQQGHPESVPVDAPDNTELAVVADQLEVPENASGIRPGLEVPYKPIDIGPKKSRKGLYAGIAIAVVAAGGFGASKVFGSADSPEDPRPSTKPTASGPVTPGPSETPSPSVSSTPETTPSATPSATPEVLEIDKFYLDTLKYKDFVNQPYNIQVAWGLAKIGEILETGYFGRLDGSQLDLSRVVSDTSPDSGGWSAHVGPIAEGKTVDDYLAKLTSQKPTDTSTDIIRTLLATEAVINGLGNSNNGDDAKKMASLWAIPGTKPYNNKLGSINTMNGTGSGITAAELQNTRVVSEGKTTFNANDGTYIRTGMLVEHPGPTNGQDKVIASVTCRFQDGTWKFQSMTDKN